MNKLNWNRIVGERERLARAAFVVAAASAAVASAAQWTFSDVHPGAPYLESQISQVAGSWAVGTLSDASFAESAAVWPIGGGTPTLLGAVPGATESLAVCTDGGTIAGWAQIGGASRAAYWNSIFSPSLLSVRKSTASRVWGTFSGQYVGSADLPSGTHAIYWPNNRRAVDLHPNGYFASIAFGVGNSDQGGRVHLADNTRLAAMWSGNKSTFRLVHPAGYFGSEIRYMYGYNGCGSAFTAVDAFNNATIRHAGYWANGGFIDLHPTDPAYTSSDAFGMIGTNVVGYVTDASGRHAAVWDLYAPVGSTPTLLPIGLSYGISTALSIWTDFATTYVGGWAQAPDGYAHAVIWRMP